ncbi:MAG TPA: class I SAM-dependent methyltransferase [Anaeromyxobacteraceae bacterium]|nr:class I SAM-dependent methyltransferase [Anaeromyxobacteraceae bacterium]
MRTAAGPQVEYAEPYFTDGRQGGYDFESAFAQAHDAARFLPELRKLEAAGLRGRVLDVGCATGSFLGHAQRRGWTVAGVEPARYARETAERRLGVPVAASLDALPVGARFEVVTLHHVLEHVDEPLEFVGDGLRRRVGRRLLVEVPNFGSAGARVRGSSWRDLRPDQHRWHFDRATLPDLLRRAGYRPISVYTLWEPLWSLRALRELLVQLCGLAMAPGVTAASEPAPAPEDSGAYFPPRGMKRALVEFTRLACRPLVRTLEGAGLGERLVVEAEPEGSAG